MELIEAVRARRMVRSFDPDRQVPAEVVAGLLRLAVTAPSAGNAQGRRFLVLADITSRARFWAATAPQTAAAAARETMPDGDGQVLRENWLTRVGRAPTLVVCFAERQAYLDRYAEPDKHAAGASPPGRPTGDPATWAIPYWYVDTGMATMILLLAAQDAGLAACFFGVPRERWSALAHTFAVPEGLEPVGVVGLGHPAADRRSPSLRRGRRPVDEVVAYGSFG